MSRRPVVVALLPDLFFAPRVADIVRAHGGEPVVVDTPEAFVAAVDRHFPHLALVELSTPGDWETAIRRVKLRPHTRQTPLYAFGSHTDAATLARARKAGADHAWARSRLLAELPAVVAQRLDPPAVHPAGWDAPPSEEALRGLELFNQGDYFEQHEHFEHAWLAEERPVREMYQGILQVGVAFLQIERGNWQGALKMFRRGLPRLRPLPERCQGVEIGEFRRAAEEIHAEITGLGPEGMAGFDRTRFPRIRYSAP